MATATLTPAPKRYETHDEHDFVVFRDVPVWKEHVIADAESGDKFGKPKRVHIDRKALEKVARNCNRRIDDTGDFAPIVLRHTDDEGRHDPKVVGFAGPFRVARFGKLSPKWAIFTTFRIFKDCAAEVRRYPRVSVEYWSSKGDPTDGHFDPISLLGAETPELDLGLRYSRGRTEGVLRRYSRDVNLARYEAGGSGGGAGVGTSVPSFPGGSNTYIPGTGGRRKEIKAFSADSLKHLYQKESRLMALSEQDLSQIVEALTPVIHTAIEERVSSLAAPTPESFDAGPHSQALRQYMADGNSSGASDYLSGLPDGDKASLSQHYQALPDEDDEKRFYQACAEGSRKIESDEASESGNAGDADDAAEKAGRELVTKYRRQRDEYRVRYEKAAKELADAGAELETLRKSERQQRRYAKCLGLRDEGYVVDPDEEVADTEAFDDAAFDKHVEMIRKSYQRVPSRPLYRQEPEYRSGDDDADAKTRRKYSKEAKELALAEGIDYDAAYRRVSAQGNGKATKEAVVG